MSWHQDVLDAFEQAGDEDLPLSYAEVWMSRSESDPENFHYVLYLIASDDWVCSCPGFRWRDKCRHLNAIRASREGRF